MLNFACSQCRVKGAYPDAAPGATIVCRYCGHENVALAEHVVRAPLGTVAPYEWTVMKVVWLLFAIPTFVGCILRGFRVSGLGPSDRQAELMHDGLLLASGFVIVFAFDRLARD